MLNTLLLRLSTLITLFLLISCDHSANQRILYADRCARDGNFVKSFVRGGDFIFTTYSNHNNSPEKKEYVVYIEGDGLISYKSGAISSNPTPVNHMMLKLAMLDNRNYNIVYIARPCQYTPMEMNPKCNYSYWSNARWSPESVNAMDEAIKSIVLNNNFHLIGFSGGGGIAVLIAAQNKRVKSILTIGGNLDHVVFNEYHGAMQSISSLNPIDYAISINNIPQLHLVGSRDKIIPSIIAHEYVKKSSSNCVRYRIIDGPSHNSGWIDIWQNLLHIPITCYKQE